MKRVRIVALAALPLVLIGGYLGWKIHHQMTTPLPLYVVQGDR